MQRLKCAVKSKFLRNGEKQPLSAGLLFDRAKNYRQFFRVCYLMITFLSAALKGGKNSTWRMVSILSGDTPLFFCNGRFSFCFLPFFRKFCFLQMFKTCLFNICERFVAKFLVALAPIVGVFHSSFCLVAKVLFLQMFKACPFNICKRFLQSFLIHVSVLWAFFNLQFAFFRKFCLCKCSKRVCLIFESVLLQSFLLHLSPLSAVLPFATK